MKTDYKKTVLNIIRCSGGLDNIVAIRRHGTKISITVADMSVVTRRGLEKDPAINGITSWPEETLDIRIKESCIDGVYAELIKHREVTKTFTFAPSEEKGGGGLETQSAQPHCEPAPETLLVTAREEGSSVSYAGKINEEKVGERKTAEDRATVSGDHRETDKNHPARHVIDWASFLFIVIAFVIAVNLVSFVLLKVPFGTQEKVSPSVSYQEKAEPAEAAEENPTQQAQPAEKDLSKKIDTLLTIGKTVGEINGSIFLLAGVLMCVTSGPYGMRITIRLMSTAALCWMIVLICNLLEGTSPVLFSAL